MLRALGTILRPFRRFGRARKGSAAVEFALVAMPFFLLTVGLVEVAMVGYAQTALDYAVSQEARRIRIGEVQTQGISYSSIKDDLCSQLNSLMVATCENNLYLDIQRFDSFVDASNGNFTPIQNNEFDPGGFGFAPGAASDIVVVRSYYRWQILTPMFQTLFANVSGGERILVSTMMFRNEPF